MDARAVQAWQAMSGEWAVLLTSYSDTAIPEPAREVVLAVPLAFLAPGCVPLAVLRALRLDTSEERVPFHRDGALVSVRLSQSHGCRESHGFAAELEGTVVEVVQPLKPAGDKVEVGRLVRGQRPQIATDLSTPEEGLSPWGKLE